MEKIIIKQKKGSEGQVMTGRNTEVFLGDKRLDNILEISFKVSGDSIAIVEMKMVGEIEIQGSPRILGNTELLQKGNENESEKTKKTKKKSRDDESESHAEGAVNG
jgi:hypothetical protein